MHAGPIRSAVWATGASRPGSGASRPGLGVSRPGSGAENRIFVIKNHNFGSRKILKRYLERSESITIHHWSLACMQDRTEVQYEQPGRGAPVQEPRAPVQELKIVYLWSKITVLDREKYSSGILNVLNPSQSITGH